MTDWKIDLKLDELLKSYEAECVKEGTFDEPLIASGREVYSPRRIIDEVRKGTPFGREYAQNWQELEERKANKYEQPQSD